MELVKVKTEDVYPDEANPRQAFEGIEELAASFDVNVERPGEPFIPPLLVRDGGIYRIVDGERRYRALRSRGAKEFWANVCDSMDEADTMAAMLATDDKAPLTEIERSRGAQRMLLLGVDPVKVEKAARFKGADRLAAVMAKADDAAEDLTLDRALAASEFLDDDEAFEKLMTCKESEWKWKASDLRQARERAERKAALDEVADAHGMRVVKEVDYAEYKRVGIFEKAAELDEFLDEIDPALGEPIISHTYYGSAEVYVRRPEEAADPEAARAEEELAHRSEELAASFIEAFSSIRTWFWSNLTSKKGPAMAELCTLARDAFGDDNELDLVCDLFPGAESIPIGPVATAVGYNLLAPWQSISPGAARSIITRGTSWNDEVNTRDVPDIADLFRAAEADGFEFGEAALPAKEAVEAFMAGDDEAEGE